MVRIGAAKQRLLCCVSRPHGRAARAARPTAAGCASAVDMWAVAVALSYLEERAVATRATTTMPLVLATRCAWTL